MRTELTNTPLGLVIEATPTRITFLVEGDAAEGFELGDEVMLVKRVEAPAPPWVPEGWMTAQDYAVREGITLGAVNSRIATGVAEAKKIPATDGYGGERVIINKTHLRPLYRGTDPAIKAAVVAAYVGGESSSKIEKRTTHTAQTILNWVRDAGHQVRGPFYDPKKAP